MSVIDNVFEMRNDWFFTLLDTSRAGYDWLTLSHWWWGEVGKYSILGWVAVKLPVRGVQVMLIFWLSCRSEHQDHQTILSGLHSSPGKAKKGRNWFSWLDFVIIDQASDILNTKSSELKYLKTIWFYETCLNSSNKMCFSSQSETVRDTAVAC